jgi:hypothetical protein
VELFVCLKIDLITDEEERQKLGYLLRQRSGIHIV